MALGEILLIAALLAMIAYVALRLAVANREQQALRDTNRFAHEIIHNAGEGIVVYDRELRYVIWNRFMEELTDLPPKEVLGKSAEELFPHIREQLVDEMLRRALGGETVSAPDIQFTIPQTGRRGWVSAVYRPHSDANGKIVGVIGLIRDITQRKSAEQQIEYQAYHDALTGLANRRLFQEHLSLALALAQRRHSFVAVLFLDLDHFKIVNDSLGHSVGDALLKQVANRLRHAVREGDTVARVGGDEFTIVLQEIQRPDDAAAIAKKVIRSIADPIEVNGHKLYVTTSIGVTVYPRDGEDAETLLKNADAAMYRAKGEGRNTYQMATSELSRTTQEQMLLESGLHQAMETGEFEVHYQPQIDLETMQLVGMEALLRWRHPERGLIGPMEFIGLAEERGMILVIGDWVLREACREAKRFHDRGLKTLRVSVNISARQFRDESLLWTVESALAEAGLDPRALELEITESVAMEDVELTRSTLAALRKSGVSIAIDDFGTGHSALSYLKRFPIDALKIDKSFIQDLPGGYADSAIVASVIQLANGLGIRVVAEGVETVEQIEFLREHACREVQGHYFSTAVPPTEIAKLLEQAK
ncbi:MAG TPA: EAL domain-containing protein [Thermoanaerobaculia bacterium]|nr:EAL domain-containing protein [Thermoanaerobaculia bacterium]